MASVNDIQHGGEHYKAGFQHWDLVCDLGLNYYAANASKYITRHRKKNGREDVLKAKHYIDKWIELIETSRMPGPVHAPVHVMLAQEKMLKEFMAANGISGTSIEADFLVSACLPVRISCLDRASETADKILAEEYTVASQGSITAEQAGKDFAALFPGDRRHSISPSVPANVAAAMEPQFGAEEWSDMSVLWKCHRCKTYFKGMDGQLPSSLHQCPDGGEPTAGYVNQDR